MAWYQAPAEWEDRVHWLASPLHGRSRWRLPVLLLGALFASGRRVVASWIRAAGVSDDYRDYERIYVRETASLRYCPHAHMAPDLALGYDFRETQRPSKGTGLFLRKDFSRFRVQTSVQTGRSTASSSGLQTPDPGPTSDNSSSSLRPADYSLITDPAEICYTPEDYIDFASQYEHIITDRLHLAITGLGLRRKVTLLPNGHHGNRAMWETWLKDLGCGWADGP